MNLYSRLHAYISRDPLLISHLNSIRIFKDNTFSSKTIALSITSECLYLLSKHTRLLGILRERVTDVTPSFQMRCPLDSISMHLLQRFPRCPNSDSPHSHRDHCHQHLHLSLCTVSTTNILLGVVRSPLLKVVSGQVIS